MMVNKLKSIGLLNVDAPDIGELTNTPAKKYRAVCKSYECSDRTGTRFRLLGENLFAHQVPKVCPHCSSDWYITTFQMKEEGKAS